MSFGMLNTSLIYDVGTALDFLGVLAALGVGHLFGDVVLQTHADANSKGIPSNDRIAAGTHPWTGWSACLRHTWSYLGAQVAALVLVSAVISPNLPGMIAALALSGSTHAVIDRRWPVQQIIAAKGCSGWPLAPFWVDQALHWAVMFVAAVAAARTHTFTKTAVAAAAGLLLIAYALHVEHRHGRGITSRPAPTDRL